MKDKPQNPFPGGLLVIGPGGRIREAPAFVHDTLGLGERYAPSIYHLFDPDDPPYLRFARVVRRGNGVVEYHLSVHGTLGGTKAFRYWTLPTTEANRRTQTVAFYITDESAVVQGFEWDRRRLRRAMLNDVRQTLSAYLDRKLTGVRAVAEVLRDRPEAAEETGARIISALDELRETFSSIERLQSSLDEVSEPDRPMQVAELPDILGAWSQGRTAIETSVGDIDPGAMLAKETIETILLPIVDNALEASRDGERVRVKATQPDLSAVVLEISDHGPGMDEQSIRRCADPFFTTKTGHLGLGLTHAASALYRLGGEWSFRSRPGRGTTVRLRLPVIQTQDLL